MPSVSENLKKATRVLGIAEISDPPREATSLLSLALDKDRTFLIAYPEYELTKSEQTLFEDHLQRRAAREPFQYIAGRQEFYGLDLLITPDVLIPRPETELLVEAALEIFRDKENIFFCEVGIGSGCISIAILHELKNARAISFDISEKALDIAERNAVSNGVSERLELGISDVFSALDGSLQFDLIVSNPPYVPAADMESLQLEVRDHEPSFALTDGKDGLSIIETLINDSPKYLKSGGYLLMEIGFNQSFALREMVHLEIWDSLDILPDLQGIPRMVKLRKNM